MEKIVLTDGPLIPSSSLTSWRLAFYINLTFLGFLLIFFKDPYLTIFKFVIKGVPTTLIITSFSIIFAFIIGLLCGLANMSKNKFLKYLSSFYVEVIRGIPLLVQLTFIYYALGKFLNVGSFVASISALSICFGAYMGEIVRSGFQAIDPGQIQAAKSLGFSKMGCFLHIQLPQTIKIIIPAVGNEFISMIKDSSLVSAIALSDILRRGNEFISRTYLSLETLMIVAIIYLFLTLSLSRIVGIIERKLNDD